MLVPRHDQRLAFALRNLDRYQLGLEESTRISGGRTLLAAQGKLVLIFARYAKAGGDVLARFGHRVHAVLLLEARVDEAPADRRVIDLGRPAESRIGLR